MSSTAESGAPSGAGQERLLQLAGLLLAPAGVLTAVLYYFGYVREQAFFGYFGVDLGSVGFSSTDYLVRSAGSVFVPVAALLVAALAVTAAHHLLAHLLTRVGHATRRTVWAVLAGSAAAAVVFGVVALAQRGDPLLHPLAGPIALGAGAVLADYVLSGLAATAPRLVVDAVTATRTLRRSLTVAVVLVAVFWGTANVAQQRGLDAAAAVEVSLPVRAQAIVYSRQPLMITGHGVGVTSLDESANSYRVRYNGLRLLVHTDETWFLLPAGWSRDNGDTVVLLPDTLEGLRVDLAPSVP